MDQNELSAAVSDFSTARLLVLTLGALIFATAGFGQPTECSQERRNVFRFENCGFDAGTSGWDAFTGVNARANRNQGHPSPGSYQIDSVDDDDGDRVTTIRSPCALIAPSSTYSITAQFRIVDPSDAVSCGFFVAGYSDNSCGGSPNGRDSAEVRVTGSGWAPLTDSYSSRSVDSSLEIYAFCYENASGPDFSMLMDNFVAQGPAARSPIFSNGFESGDTSAWSVTVP